MQNVYKVLTYNVF